jgi:hypothetical protein
MEAILPIFVSVGDVKKGPNLSKLLLPGRTE